ncbi:MAG TPA: ATP-binding protein [Candidatus Acidoferrum sp.]|nr:ATP-binding protein [Candidatus Acidoferrum sp.]
MTDSLMHGSDDHLQPGGDGSSDLLLKLELTSDPNLLCAVRGAVERLNESFGFSAEESRAIIRAVDEALTNIIRHAYSGHLDQPIGVYVRALRPNGTAANPQGIEILLCDRGPAVDPEKMCGRALDDVKPGGLGLHFIQKSMDVVEYERADGTNRLRLVKYVAAPKK